MRQGHKQRWHGTRCVREKGRVGRVMSVVRTQETQDTRRNTRLAWKEEGSEHPGKEPFPVSYPRGRFIVGGGRETLWVSMKSGGKCG